MARSKRRSFRGRGRRPKGDWVYRGEATRADGGVDGMASYAPSITTLVAGIVQAEAVVLYDSRMYLADMVRTGGPIVPAYMLPNAARAQGGRPLILRVQGHFSIQPSSWAVGNTYSICLRIMKTEQDLASGAALMDANYGAWTGGLSTQAAEWANARGMNLWERRYEKLFNASEEALDTHRINVPLRVTLNSDQALYLYMESQGGSVNCGLEFWLRSFVVDESTG